MSEPVTPPLFRFLGWVTDHFQTRAALTRLQAVKVAHVTLANFLAMEAIVFGDADYAWDQRAAREIADSELEHWAD